MAKRPRRAAEHEAPPDAPPGATRGAPGATDALTRESGSAAAQRARLIAQPRAEQLCLPLDEPGLLAEASPRVAAAPRARLASVRAASSVEAQTPAARPVRQSRPRNQAEGGKPVAQQVGLEARARARARQRFGELRTALEEGWEIVQPIFERPLWSVVDDSRTAFNFVLRRERATRLVTVPAAPSVQRFIRDNHLAVDYRG